MTIFLTSAGSAGKLWNQHLYKRAVNALYGQAVLYEQGDPRPLPGGSGHTLSIPKYVGSDGMGALTENAAVTTGSVAMSNYTGTIAGYGEARKYSDFVMYVNEIPQFVSDEIHDMTQNARKQLDDLAIAVLSASGIGAYIKPDGATAIYSSINTTVLKQRALFDANSTLAGANANPYSDGTWHGVFHPNQVHDLFVGAAASGTPLGEYGAGYLEATEIGAKALEKASIGVLGNVRIYQTTWGSQAVTSVGGLMSAASGAAGHQAFILAPGAFAKVDLATARLKTYWKPAGSAGTADPIDQFSTAGVKFYATAVAMDVGTTAAPKRLVKVVSGNGTF